ncbi:MAG: alpha/beta hydrolase [Propionibacteriaceae bacterium]|nr:alpha/beta hydrolase [Propionibacteriaceae bacterium]
MRPRVVFVHGSLSSALEWTGYAELLPQADVVTLDLPGHGTRAGEPFTTDAAVGLIAEAVAGHDPGQPVVLAGHSLGGYMACVYAARHPQRLAGLILLGASGDPGSRLAAVYRGFAWLIERVSHERTARLRNRIARMLGLSDEQIPEASAYDALPASWRAVMQDCPPELLTSVTCPVLLINGQFDQMRLNERRYLDLARSSRLAIVPRATHLAPLTHAGQVAHHISDFLGSLSPG